MSSLCPWTLAAPLNLITHLSENRLRAQRLLLRKKKRWGSSFQKVLFEKNSMFAAQGPGHKHSMNQACGPVSAVLGNPPEPGQCREDSGSWSHPSETCGRWPTCSVLGTWALGQSSRLGPGRGHGQDCPRQPGVPMGMSNPPTQPRGPQHPRETLLQSLGFY